MQIILIVLLIICAVLARIFLRAESNEEYVKAVVLKGLASLCFVIIGLVCSPGTHVAAMIIAGLIIGSIADVLLNLRMVFEEKGQLIFLVGIVVFLLISLVKTPPRVSIPRDRGVTSSSSTSVTSPASTPP